MKIMKYSKQDEGEWEIDKNIQVTQKNIGL